MRKITINLDAMTEYYLVQIMNHFDSMFGDDNLLRDQDILSDALKFYYLECFKDEEGRYE